MRGQKVRDLMASKIYQEGSFDTVRNIIFDLSLITLTHIVSYRCYR